MEITRNPLCWPNNVPRTAPQNKTHPQFQLPSITAAVANVKQEVNRLNKLAWDFTDENLIISSNLKMRMDGLPSGQQTEPSDTGIAVFSKLRFARNGKWHDRHCVLTCDKWNRTAYNLSAIARDIGAQRARERWGCSTVEQSFAGYIAIPEKCGGDAWWITLAVKPTASKDEINQAYKSLSKVRHPDMATGSHAAFNTLQEAYEQAMSQFRGQQ